MCFRVVPVFHRKRRGNGPRRDDNMFLLVEEGTRRNRDVSLSCSTNMMVGNHLNILIKGGW